MITAGRLRKMAVHVVLVQSLPERAAAMRGRANTLSWLLVSALLTIAVVSNAFAYDNREISAAKSDMIAESIASYRGNCPCPYFSAADGSSCGRRSAYSKRGGTSPLCYQTDITDAQAIEWLRKNRR